MTDHSHAARQARYRARQAEVGLESKELLRAILSALGDLQRAVDNLAKRVEKASRDDSADSRTSRDGRKAPARAREDQALAPYGGQRAVVTDVTEDAWRVVQAIPRSGASLGGLRDYLGDGWTTARTTAALVYLQAQGEARREPGHGAAPDQWFPCDPETPAALGAPPDAQGGQSSGVPTVTH